MTERKSGKTKEQIKRLKIKKETLKDLDTGGKARVIKGGQVHSQTSAPALMYCSCGGAC